MTIDLPRSLEFAVITEARKHGEYFTDLFKPTFLFDGQFGYFKKPIYRHTSAQPTAYQLISIEKATDGQSFEATLAKIDSP